MMFIFFILRNSRNKESPSTPKVYIRNQSADSLEIENWGADNLAFTTHLKMC